MRKNLLILTILVLSLAFLGCPPKTETTTATATDAQGEILVGEYGSMSGNQATFGQSTHNGIMIAIEEINAAGGVNGRKIRILTEDDQSKQEEAASAVQKLISRDNVVAVLGEVASSASIAAAPICQNAKVPMISPSSTNPEVTKKGDYIFRMCFLDDYQGSQLAVFAAERLKVKRVAVLIDVKSDYSTGLAKFFEDKFKQLGGTIVARANYAGGDSDFKSQLTSVKAANPEVLFVPGYYTEIGQIAIQARDLGLTAPLLGGDGWESPKLLEIGGKALEGCFFSTHYSPGETSPIVRGFVEKYKERHQQTPDALAALGYDAAKLLADAMKRAGSTDGTKVRDALAATKGFEVVTGTINMGPGRDPVGKKIVIVEIKNGQLVFREIIEATGADAGPATATTTTTGSLQ
jgi:branched-chain amino acid transport system substrate-binding protein